MRRGLGSGHIVRRTLSNPDLTILVFLVLHGNWSIELEISAAIHWELTTPKSNLNMFCDVIVDGENGEEAAKKLA
jgi:hypothetical protein